jgi:hypothetical protein
LLLSLIAFLSLSSGWVGARGRQFSRAPAGSRYHDDFRSVDRETSQVGRRAADLDA